MADDVRFSKTVGQIYRNRAHAPTRNASEFRPRLPWSKTKCRRWRRCMMTRSGLLTVTLAKTLYKCVSVRFNSQSCRENGVTIIFFIRLNGEWRRRRIVFDQRTKSTFRVTHTLFGHIVVGQKAILQNIETSLLSLLVSKFGHILVIRKIFCSVVHAISLVFFQHYIKIHI